MKNLLLAILALALTACVVTPVYYQVTDPGDREFIKNMYQYEQLEFTLPMDEAPTAWERAKVFLARHSGTVNHVYDFAVYSGGGGSSSDSDYIMPGYRVVRLDNGDGSVTFWVMPFEYNTTQARLQGKYLAHYMRTGELRDNLVNRKVNLGQIINPGRYQ